MNVMPSFHSLRQAVEVPFPDESLLGFAHRTLCSTVFRQLERALTAAGLKTVAGALPTAEFDDAAVRRLAGIFDCEPSSIYGRTYKSVEWPGDASVAAINFFGAEVRKTYREFSIRRVSPRALCLEPYHRALWELRPFSFDPSTMEFLLDTCPNCGESLGWYLVHAPQFCEKCIDHRGFHFVDLRDFPQATVEVDDVEALEFVTNLISPLEGRRSAARRLLPTAWEGLSNSVIFEAVIAMTIGLRRDVGAKQKALPRGRKLTDFATLTPELLSLAGRAVIGSHKGFRALAGRYRATSHERPGFYGAKKEFGSLGSLMNDRQLPRAVRSVLNNFVSNAATQNANEFSLSDGEIADSELLPMTRVAEKLNVTARRLALFANAGEIETIRSTAGSRSIILMRVTDVLPFVDQLRDVLTAASAAKRLGLPQQTLRYVADRGLVKALNGPVVAAVAAGEGYSAQSIEELHRRIWSRVKPKGKCSTVPLPVALKVFGCDIEVPWVPAIEAIVNGEVEAFSTGGGCNLQLNLAVVDVEGFVSGVRKYLRLGDIRTEEWISASTAAEILGVNDALFYAFLASESDELPSRRTGRHPYQRREVQAVAERYIFTPELAKQIGVPVQGVKIFLKGLGIEPVMILQGNKGFVYDRAKSAPVIKERKKHLSLLPKNSTDPRVKLVLRVVGEGQSLHRVAAQLGVDRRRAAAWLKTWNTTGRFAG